jgi:hypothetical protein
MAKNYRILVFGKKNCAKCKQLNQRIDDLLAEPDWAEFEKCYYELGSVEGLVAFCKAECINPQRVPAFVVTRFNESTGAYDFVPNPAPGAADPVCKTAKLYQHLGLQTDYTEAGKGVIPPKMIEAVLQQARM